MKTTLDLVDVTWDRLNSSSLKTAITGKIYKYRRPVNSNVEDVVINSLPVTNEQLQRAVVNVNVFVPDVTISVNGNQDKVPNHVRLKQLAQTATSELNDRLIGDYSWEVQQQTVLEDEESQQHFVNIRLQFYISNI